MIEGYDHMPVHVHWVTVQEIPLYRTQRLMPEQVAGLSCCGRKSSYFYCRYNRGCSGAGMKVKYLISRVQYFLAMISPKRGLQFSFFTRKFRTEGQRKIRALSNNNLNFFILLGNNEFFHMVWSTI